MSYFQVIKGVDCDGNPVEVHVSADEGNVITEGHRSHRNHIGAMRMLTSYFGDIADQVAVDLLVQVGSTKDLDLILAEAALEGYWELEMFRGTAFTAAGTAVTPRNPNDFHTDTSDATFTSGPTIATTTVDAASASGQTVLNVTATADFTAGDWVKLDSGETGATNNEFAQIASIQAGVSLTMESNLENSYTNEDVDSTGERILHTHAEGGEKNTTVAAGATPGGELVMIADEDYLLRMTNYSSAASRASNKFWWIEEDKQT